MLVVKYSEESLTGFLQLGLLASIILYLNNTDSQIIWPSLLLITFYVSYIINALCSPTYSYLLNTRDANTIHSSMKSLFETAPVFHFHIECYHYETKRTKVKKDGETKIEESQDKVTTHKGSEKFHYYSWKDISGLFLLDVAKFLSNRFQKVYIKLKLNLVITFAEDGTLADYNLQKSLFHAKNKNRDDHMTTWETEYLPGLDKYFMVRVSDNKAPYVNASLYLLFTFIPFIELYKIYVSLYCESQAYTIKKPVSSKKDLNIQASVKKYEDLYPKININGCESIFNQDTKLVESSPFFPSKEDLDLCQNNDNQPVISSKTSNRSVAMSLISKGGSANGFSNGHYNKKTV
jgi:hypothetical protein